jgi:hypothetical protein
MSEGDDRTSRLTLHRWVDGAAIILLVALAASGGFLRWTFAPGRGWLKELHAWLAETFLLVMVAHLLLHRRWISANLFRPKRSQR